MFAAYRSPTHSYRDVSVHTATSDASPHRLIALLYEGGLDAIGQARLALKSGDIARRGSATTRAIRIVQEGLMAALDDRAGELATRLRSLYQYMSQALLVANLRADDAKYAEVAKLLGQLREGWDGIAPGR